MSDSGEKTPRAVAINVLKGGFGKSNVLLDGSDPREFIVPVVDDLDLFPSHEALEEVETNLKSAMASSQRLFRNVGRPASWRSL